MSAEGVLVANPKDNNVMVKITFVGRDGTEKKIKTLRPGEGVRVDQKAFTVTTVPRPPRLLLTSNGECIPDSGVR